MRSVSNVRAGRDLAAFTIRFLALVALAASAPSALAQVADELGEERPRSAELARSLAAGHRVSVERGAGELSSFSDEQYRAAGVVVHQLQLRQERLVLDTEAYVDTHLIRHLQAGAAATDGRPRGGTS